jgi:DNA polymerase III subunit beta
VEELMNFTISKLEFYEALHKVVGVVPQKTTISILTCILLELKDNKLSITGTDLEISTTLTLNVTATEDGSVAIPAKLLVEIVRELPDVPLNLSSELSDKIVIKTDKGEFKISTQPKEDFPKITIEEGEFVFQLEAKLLAQMTNKTIFAVSTDELRPALTGIYLDLSPTDLRFVGTDGHRLARFIYRKFHLKKDTRYSLIIPTKALNLVLRHLEENEKVDIQIGEDHVVFSLKDAIIYSKLVNGTYPNYERVIPVGNDQRLFVNRELLISTLRRVAIFSSNLTHQVRLVLMPNEMTIYSEDIDFGAEAKETIPAKFSDEWLQLGYNSTYLMDILRHLDTEEIVFEIKDNSSAAIIRPVPEVDDEDTIMLLMPIRINEEPTEAAEAKEGDDSQESEVNF